MSWILHISRDHAGDPSVVDYETKRSHFELEFWDLLATLRAQMHAFRSLDEKVPKDKVFGNELNLLITIVAEMH